MAKLPTTERRGPEQANDESRAFRDAVRDVKPLKHSPSATATATAAAAGPRPRRRKAPPPAGDDLETSMPLLTGAEIGPADALSFHRIGVRTQVVRRLRRGLFPIEAELDLHGLTQSAAREQLADFLGYHRAAGSRCVRIIHGKGYRSGARGPVLKMAVDSWLRRHLDVMAFTSARAMDGGTGAVYVLLRA